MISIAERQWHARLQPACNVAWVLLRLLFAVEGRLSAERFECLLRALLRLLARVWGN